MAKGLNWNHPNDNSLNPAVAKGPTARVNSGALHPDAGAPLSATGPNRGLTGYVYPTAGNITAVIGTTQAGNQGAVEYRIAAGMYHHEHWDKVSRKDAGVYIRTGEFATVLAIDDAEIVYYMKLDRRSKTDTNSGQGYSYSTGTNFSPTNNLDALGGNNFTNDFGTQAWIGGIHKASDSFAKNESAWGSTIMLKLKNPIRNNGVNHSYVLYTGLQPNDIGKLSIGSSVSAGEAIGSAARERGHSHGFGLYFVTVSNTGSLGCYTGSDATAMSDVMYSLLESCDSPTGYMSWNNSGSGSAPDSNGGGGGGDAGPTGPTIGEIATAAAFSTFFQMPSLMEQQEAIALTGNRSLMNDKPLLPFIEQIAAGSLRNFMSMPNGNFYAFYPDYFGGLGRHAYWKIKDIEIIDGRIDLSDDNLATHVFVVGDTSAVGGELGYGTIDWIDRINSAGVVNVFNAFMADFLNETPSNTKAPSGFKPSLAKKADAVAFLQKYGARPYYEEAPAVRSPIYETFLAYQRFCLLWAAQFRTTFEFTYMPELFPGGLVELEEHGIQCYVEQVVHSGSYESGFRTVATLSAPSAVKDKNGNPVHPDKAWVHAGMIRADIMGGAPSAKGSSDTPAKKAR
jgi:hypothetical protein